ncbi:MAG: hypothetical protein V3R33_01700 [Anaerolineales bacterium]
MEREISADWVIFSGWVANPGGQPLLEKVPPAPTQVSAAGSNPELR